MRPCSPVPTWAQTRSHPAHYATDRSTEIVAAGAPPRTSAKQKKPGGGYRFHPSANPSVIPGYVLDCGLLQDGILEVGVIVAFVRIPAVVAVRLAALVRASAAAAAIVLATTAAATGVAATVTAAAEAVAATAATTTGVAVTTATAAVTTRGRVLIAEVGIVARVNVVVAIRWADFVI